MMTRHTTEKMNIRFKNEEFKDTGNHAVGVVSDYTLCGLSMDGDTETTGEYDNVSEKITCEQCLEIIRYCRKIKINQ